MLKKAVFIVTSVVSAACADRTPPEILEIALTPNDNESVPLAARLTLTLDEPARLTLSYDDGERQEVRAPSAELASTHTVPVLGLRPDKRYAIRAVVTDASGNETRSDALELQSEPLPEIFPTIELIAARPERMEPGVTLFDTFRWPESGAVSDYGLLVAVDERGEVVWFYQTDHGVGDALMTSNGNILYQSGRKGLAFEIDMLGNVVQRWHTSGVPKEVPESSVPIATDTIHHEIHEMPSGNLLALSTELRDYDDYYTSEIDPEAPRGKSTVVGDVLVEFARDGSIVGEWKLLDIFDPHRIGYRSLDGGFWTDAYSELPHGELRDWAHVNAVFYDEVDDAFILSPRRQDAVIKMNRDGEIIWILGTHDNWKDPWKSKLLAPKGELTWFFHQHAPMVTRERTILLFDNGTFGASPFTGEASLGPSESYSRAVEYAIDEEAMEVRQVWAYGEREEERFYSTFVSDADRLAETGNVLITDGGKIQDEEGRPTARPGVHRFARIVEVTHRTPAEEVFELIVRGEPPDGWHVYRADRIPSLYGNVRMSRP